MHEISEFSKKKEFCPKLGQYVDTDTFKVPTGEIINKAITQF